MSKFSISHTLISQVVNSLITKLNLVSREEFEIQARVLLKTRTKLELLEKKLAELEQMSQKND